MRLHDHLGHLIPPGRVRRPHLEHGLLSAMQHRRFSAGPGAPSVPNRYVVAMHPSDLAWLDPELPDLLARALERHAQSAGLGSVSVEFESDARLDEGCPQFWAGFAQDDLLVLVDPSATVEVFAGPRHALR